MNERVSASVPAETSVSHLAWSSVIAGVVMAIVIMLLMMLLGFSIGLASINPDTEQNPFGGLGMGSAIWWVLSNMIALFLGGWVAARMAGLQRQFDGALHGLVMWALYTLLSVYLLTTAIGAIVSGTFSVIGKVFSSTGQAMGQTAEKAMQAMGGQGGLIQTVSQKLPNLTEPEKQQVKDIGMRLVKGQDMTEADRQTLTGLLTRHGGMSPEEAAQNVRQWEQQFRQASSEVGEKMDIAKDKAGQAADAVAKAAFWAFIMLLLGAGAAAAGGSVGRVKGSVRI